MGLRADIYKSGGRSFANGGYSDRLDEVTVVNVDGPFEPTNGAPAVMLVAGNLRGTVKVVPAVETPTGYVAASGPDLGMGGVGPMMGGSYVGTSDSRFREAVESLLGQRFYGAVPLHDRFETAEQYEMLSR